MATHEDGKQARPPLAGARAGGTGRPGARPEPRCRDGVLLWHIGGCLNISTVHSDTRKKEHFEHKIFKSVFDQRDTVRLKIVAPFP